MRSRNFKYCFITLTALLWTCTALAQTMSDTIDIYFRQGKSDLDLSLDDNRRNLDSITGILRTITAGDSIFQITGLRLIGTASPEGSVALNNRLSATRAHTVARYLSAYTQTRAGIVDERYSGRDWTGLYALIAADTATPGREEALETVGKIIEQVNSGNSQPTALINHLRTMNGGRTYSYIYRTLYPSLRSTRVNIGYTRRFSLQSPVEPGIIFTPVIEETMELADIDYTIPAVRKPFYMALKTNLLYDAAALPNLGAEFYVGKNFSVGADWMYGWWDNDNRHRYWRAYGGVIAGRWWFGSKAHEKPLTGHHVGLFAGVVTYDFELGGQGYMGGKPGATLWDRCNLVAGIEYGYSLPLARRLNMDFTIGLGYLGGKYVKYKPENGRYVWESTHRLAWWGPVKAEISLVWLIGRGNYNDRKGGKL